MSTYSAPMSMPVASAQPEARAAFIRKTYSHLAAAILIFTGLIGLMLQTGLAESMTRTLMGSRFGWLMVMGGFMGGASML